MNVSRPAVLLIGVVACSAPRQNAVTAPNTVVITATDFAFAAPDTIRAGLTEFRMINSGIEPHQAVIVGAGSRSFMELQAAMMTPGPIPTWPTFPAAPGVVARGDTATVVADLAPGNYLIACFIPSPDGKLHAEKGMFRRLVVTADSTATARTEPVADVTVTLSDYDFTLSRPLSAGRHTIRVENAGPQLHELTIERLLPGKTLADWQAWMAGGMRGTPPTEPAGGLVGPERGKVGWLRITLRPGKYLLNCYVPDAKDGKPHYEHGMVREITVS